MTQQLVLGALRSKDTAVFDTYFPEQNQEAICALKNMLAEKSDQFIYLWGPAGSGKTHLTQACTSLGYELGISSMYMALASLPMSDTPIFEALENYQLVCLDDLDAIAGKADWEEMIFHFFNRFKANAGKLVVTSHVSPREIAIALPDLKSRLQGGLCFYLDSLSEQGKYQALCLAAQSRGFRLPTSVAEYIFHHYSRNTQDLFSLLDKLDDASLIEGKRITIPFVRRVIQENKR